MVSPNERTVTLVVQAFSAWSHGDLDAALATIDPEIEWHAAFPLPDLPPDKRVFHGHDEVRELWEAFRSVWAEIMLETTDVLFADEDAAVIEVRFRGRAASSGVEVERSFFYLLRLRADRLVLNRPFDTGAEALEAAGVKQGD